MGLIELVPHLKYGVVKTFGTGRFMKLKNNMATRQRAFIKANKERMDRLNSFSLQIKDLKEDEISDELKVQFMEYAEDMQAIQVEMMEYVLVADSVDELCTLVEKVGPLVTVEDIVINDLTLDEVVSLGYRIVRLDDAASEEEAAEKKKIA